MKTFLTKHRILCLAGLLLGVFFIVPGFSDSGIYKYSGKFEKNKDLDVDVASLVPEYSSGNYSESVLDITLEEAVEMALSESSQIKTARIDSNLKTRAYDTRWNVFIPSVTFTGSGIRSSTVTDYTSMFSSPLPSLPPSPAPTESDHWALSATLSASLNLNIALVEGIKASRNNLHLGYITLKQAEKQVERDVKKLFYSILLMQDNLSLQKELLENSKNRYEQAKINYQQGRVPELTVLQTQVTYENMKPSVMELEHTVRQQLRSFALVIGMEEGVLPNLVGEIKPEFVDLDKTVLAKKYSASSFDVISLQKNIMLMENSLMAAKFQMYTPSLSFSYAYTPTMSDVTAPFFDSESWTDNGRFTASLYFDITGLLPFSSTYQKMLDIQANLDKLRLNLNLLVQNNASEIISLVEKLEKSKSSMEVSQMSVGLAQKAYDMTLTAFQNGTTELLDLRDSESQLAQARLGLANEGFNYISALLDLEYLVNADLTEITEKP